MRNKRIITVLAAVLAMAVFAMGAFALISWNSKMAERFEADSAMQDKLTNDKTWSPINKSVTDNGMTITAVQSLGDKKGMYILFKIEPPEGVTVDPRNDYLMPEVLVDGGSINNFSSFVADSTEYYEVWILDNHIFKGDGKIVNGDKDVTVTELDTFNGKNITVTFDALKGDADIQSDNPYSYVKVEGEWTLSWTIENEDNTQVYNINKAVSDYDIVIESLEISPLSYTLVMSGGDIEALAATKADISLDGDILIGMPEFILSDGTVFDYNGFGGGGSNGLTDGKYTEYNRFTKILNVEKLTGLNIDIAGQMIAVDLTR